MAKCSWINILLMSPKTDNLHLSPRSSDFTRVVFLKQERKNIFIYQRCFLLKVLSRFLLKVYFHLPKVEYHPFQRPQELVDYCRSRDIVFGGYCPLAKGEALTHPSVIQLAKKYGRTPAQICIRWSIQVMEGGNKNVSPLSGKKNANSSGFVHQTRIYTESIFAFTMLVSCELTVLYWKFGM